MTQRVKNPPAMRETWVRSLSWEDPLERGMATHSSILAWKFPMERGAWWATVHGVTKTQTRLSHFHYTVQVGENQEDAGASLCRDQEPQSLWTDFLQWKKVGKVPTLEMKSLSTGWGLPSIHIAGNPPSLLSNSSLCFYRDSLPF